VINFQTICLLFLYSDFDLHFGNETPTLAKATNTTASPLTAVAEYRTGPTGGYGKPERRKDICTASKGGTH
jgi:hypothetical protein